MKTRNTLGLTQWFCTGCQQWVGVLVIARGTEYHCMYCLRRPRK